MPSRSIVSWNTMIACHNNYEEDAEALKLFVLMRRTGSEMSEFTLSSVLCACAAKRSFFESRQLHSLAHKTAIDSNVFVETALLNVYAKCNAIGDACRVFNDIAEKSLVTWSSMMAGYVHNDLPEDALVLVQKAQQMGLEWTTFTLSVALSACATIAATIEGTQLHSTIVRIGFDSDVFVATALIDMYSKCGLIMKACYVFSEMKERNIVLWNAMIAGFCRHSRCLETMILFEKMQQMGVPPNEITYVSVLSACSHAGLVDIGRYYFDLMRQDDTVQPNVLHYSCMIDVLGRSGFINEAFELMNNMPSKPTASMWGSVLASCRNHGVLQLARVAADHLFKIEPKNAGNYVLLSNIYAANKQWEEVAVSRKHLKDSGAKKEMGRSWIEVSNKVHVFVVGELRHPMLSEIYAKLEDLGIEMKKLAYKVHSESDLHDVTEEEKRATADAP
ncbi:hypothetical protein HPP92_009799 [Vanilla planifolia]|uniref:Pentatricopeptide repeat-containing protein n=1 Tax=Vanilla planifolia TaxID=51239 RepID=A0A835R580_VANPL|nr:hypothetical protein HPP92_009799 [Vanilla planifolia]